jgi:CBS domain containing-hemolysin-like protein
MIHGPSLKGFNRNEFAAMADLSEAEGQLAPAESKILKNLLVLKNTYVKDVMTPRVVVFSVPQTLRVDDFITEYDDCQFSRIPVYGENIEDITGIVLKDELLLAHAKGENDRLLSSYSRETIALLDTASLAHALDEMLKERSQIALAVDEYGGMEGLVTLEDLLETLLGLEIVDESDDTVDMRSLARRLWSHRAQQMGINVKDFDHDP